MGPVGTAVTEPDLSVGDEGHETGFYLAVLGVASNGQVNGAFAAGFTQGKEWQRATAAVALAAHAQRHTVNVSQPGAGMSSDIDVENDRLNVFLDADFRIAKFSVG
jgi:hypothetical protein